MINGKWKHLGTEKKFNDNVFDIEHRRYWYEPAGGTIPFSILNMADWVVIIPVTKDNKVVLVKQFRAGVGGYIYEFPGGAVEKNEELLNAGARELLEETGYIAENMELLSVINPNPAFMTNKCGVVLAEGCTQSGKMDTDMFEDVEPEEFTKEELKQMIREGNFIHSIALAALGVYLSSK